MSEQARVLLADPSFWLYIVQWACGMRLVIHVSQNPALEMLNS